jgi:hypothetical protein
MPRTTGGKQRTYYGWEEPIYVIIRLDVTSHALRFCTNAHIFAMRGRRV